MLQSKIKQFYYQRSEDSMQSTHMIDILKIHSKFLKYTLGKLKEAWKTSIFLKILLVAETDADLY